ncbi:MBL fold metallo-hydrolase [Chloroflexota bacterium]
MAPDDIDTIILTHGHPDHIGGITDTGGKLAFPSARYVIWKDEWDFWTSEQAELRLDEHGNEVLLGFARKNVPPIRDQIDLLEHETEITPGIHAVAAPGHTPGHMAVAVYSNGEQLLCISDTVLHPIHMEKPEWCALVDFDPVQVVATRRRLLSRAVSDGALILAFHFLFPGLGRVVQKGKGWQWQPTKTS